MTKSHGKQVIYGYSWAELLALMCVLSFHLSSVFMLIPFGEILKDEPMTFSDHAVHTHRVHYYRTLVYRGELPWGVDPVVSAGTLIRPNQDVGAKPQQFVSLLFPMVSSGKIVRLFLLVVALSAPLFTLIACRSLRFTPSQQLWTILCLLTPLWLYKWITFYLYYGLAAFAAASFCGPVALCNVVKFVKSPGHRSYWSVCFILTLLPLLHCLGPVLLVPALVWLLGSNLKTVEQWKVALVGAVTLILLLNAFWLIPFALSTGAPKAPGIQVPELQHLKYSSWSQELEGMFPWKILIALVCLSLSIHGFLRLRQQAGTDVAIALLLGGGTALVIKYTGSFVPLLVKMQPSRFILPALAFFVFPVGLAVAELFRKIKLPACSMAASLGLILLVAGRMQGKPSSIPVDSSVQALKAFISAKTRPGDRLLIQSREYYEPKVLALVLNREVIGNTFPERTEAAQFLPGSLWGKPLESWSDEALSESFKRWGISWVFSCNQRTHEILSRFCNQDGQRVGAYRAFDVSESPSRFLVGSGEAVPTFNRIELDNLYEPDHGWIVLRYRYHPAWETSPPIEVRRFEVPEDPTGFIALHNPPKHLVLQFNSWAMFHRPWPPAVILPQQIITARR